MSCLTRRQERGDREGQHGAQLGDEFRLELLDGPEGAGGAHIREDHDRELALFLEKLHVRVAHPRGHVPIFAPHVIPYLILPHLLELHAASFENAVVFTREDIPDDAVGVYLYPPYLLENFFWNHIVLV